MSFEWNGTTIPAASAAFFSFPVCVMASGHEVAIPVHALTGRRPGPTLLISATSHGEELWSCEFVRRIHAYFISKDFDFAGTLLLAPNLNPQSFESGHRNTPIDLHNLNRVFPGSERGWYSEILSHSIAKHLLPKADIIFDYHGGGSDTVIHYTYTAPQNSERNRQVHEIALASGAEVLWEHVESRGTLTNWGEELGKLCVTPEIGGGGLITDIAYFDKAIADLVNMMKVIEMVSGQPEASQVRIVVTKGRTLKPCHGGLFIPSIGLDMMGKSVPGGTLLGTVVSPYSFAVLDELFAPYEITEMMQIRNRISKVHPGDYAYIIGDGSSGYRPT